MIYCEPTQGKYCRGGCCQRAMSRDNRNPRNVWVSLVATFGKLKGRGGKGKRDRPRIGSWTKKKKKIVCVVLRGL